MTRKEWAGVGFLGYVVACMTVGALIGGPEGATVGFTVAMLTYVAVIPVIVVVALVVGIARIPAVRAWWEWHTTP